MSAGDEMERLQGDRDRRRHKTILPRSRNEEERGGKSSGCIIKRPYLVRDPGERQDHLSSDRYRGFWTVVSVYAPQCGCTEMEKATFYEELDDVIRRVPKSDNLTIGGDFNGHVGQDRRGFERMHGGRGFGSRNQDGERIMELAEAHNLAITSTFFTKRESQKVMYSSGGRKSEKDHVLKWQLALAGSGLNLNMRKTEVMSSIEEDGHVFDANETAFTQAKEFKYLGGVLSADGPVDAAVSGRIKCAWLKRRESTGILCDRRCSRVLKGKTYRSVIRPTLMYGSECLPLSRAHERMWNTVEMRMLRWACGLTRRDKVPNDDIRAIMQTAPIQLKLRAQRLRWYGHVMRRPSQYPTRQAMEMDVAGKRPRGTPKKRWKYAIRKDMEEITDITRVCMAAPGFQAHKDIIAALSINWAILNPCALKSHCLTLNL
ncbi:hypothetical protein ANCCEY_07266 [Ancylostoma ceylanicum]|uniref:Endonuclease/exonuclease/phosphatase domain-containing protein n=1 Tax=Ancylostoma ceylanicum TaxID=53326 RepID=A0A0D6LR05_9BILA|nr:hypothetical protein ANCCEY_07266 [Ancylostoma ceylanicum]